jgi:hypothetical protein
MLRWASQHKAFTFKFTLYDTIGYLPYQIQARDIRPSLLLSGPKQSCHRLLIIVRI